ncbi:DUF1028 domain-containing protein [Oceaniglobus trochenteri]|uniref:DUF1028 domain-containing protein n=1 Tax=Oceaniglobus trochenteri TaxID=2763260 RepID=UPI001D000BA2|nr:DUF1028 domain-containing protein [Oceaniglobus trochenteri]
MTFSILAQDPETGAIGGAAATGSLCVGGWVLRGRLDAGMSASQGAAPSTFWGEDVLTGMAKGETAGDAVARITGADAGRAERQLSALDLVGGGAAFDGTQNTPEINSRVFENGVAAGNMLARRQVIDAMVRAFKAAEGSFAARLIAALRGAERAGSDSRGLLSAALLVLHPDSAPLTLRIDHHASDPIGALSDLHRRATTGDYAGWATQVPTLNDPQRGLD